MNTQRQTERETERIEEGRNTDKITQSYFETLRQSERKAKILLIDRERERHTESDKHIHTKKERQRHTHTNRQTHPHTHTPRLTKLTTMIS